MPLFLTVLEIAAPVFILAMIGYIWVKTGHEYRVQFVTRLTMTLSVPCLIFVSLMQTKIDPAALADLSLATAASYGAVSLAMLAFMRLSGLDQRSFTAPLIFGNTGNLGLPLVLFAFGETGLGYGVVVMAIMMIWSFTFGIWLVAGGGSTFKALLREPVVGATLLGALFLWQGWQTPRFLTNTLELLAQIAIPVMLITLGVAVARLRPGKLGQALWLSLFKAGICVGIAWAAGHYFSLEPVGFAVLVLQLATPVAVTSYMIAEKYGADAEAVSGLVVVSTGLSVLLLPILLGVLL
ncbi:MAG: AEC family transporter [Mangrovicoccus sp.]|nr:AEC family transporter [Mangrovicoccus sp.]